MWILRILTGTSAFAISPEDFSLVKRPCKLGGRRFIYFFVLNAALFYFSGHIARPNLCVQILAPHKPNHAHTRKVLLKKVKRQRSAAREDIITSESRDANAVVFKLPAVAWRVKEMRWRKDDARRLGWAWLGFCCWQRADGGPASLSDGTLTAQ